MVTPDDIRFLREAVAPLCEPLHRAFDRAGDSADGYFIDQGMHGSGFAREKTDLIRATARKNLTVAQRAGELGTWVVGRTGSSGQTHLRDGMLVAKILHVSTNQLVPSPGPNQRRNAFYRNEQLRFFGVEASKLLALWWIDPKTSETSIRMVRPSGRWRYGERHVCDVDFMLPRASEELESLAFIPDDSEIQLPIDFTDDEADDDTAYGG